MPSAPDHGFRLSEGDFLGSYRILDRVTLDNDGEIYLAKNARRFATVLVRVFPETCTADAAMLSALEQRCEAAAGMQHPGIGRCTALLRERGLAYVAMDLPDGPRGEPITLSAALQESGGVMPEERVIPLLQRLGAALAFAHHYRGEGLPHGRLAPDRIYLTAQRQPRLTDFHLSHAVPPSADIQALGHLTARLLTGVETAPTKPTVPTGLSRRWQRFVQGCLMAGEENGFATIEAATEALEAAPSRKRGPLIWSSVVAALLLIITIAGIGLLREKQSRDLSPVETDSGAQSAAPGHPPRSPDAGADAEIRLQRGLAEVNNVKKDAEEAYSRAVELQPTDGFGARIEALKTVRAGAAKHLAGMEFAEAAAGFRQVHTEAQALLTWADQRTDAIVSRRAAESAREAAEIAHADLDAGPAWVSADGNWTQASADFEACRFSAAAVAFREATRLFEQAASGVARGRDIAVAKAAYTELRTEEADLFKHVDAAVLQQLETLVRGAEAAEGDGKTTAAARDYRQAEEILSTALDEAAARVRGPVRPPTEQFPRPTSGNLVVNGDMEQGSAGQPAGWSRVDGLTTFWETKGKPGSCLRFDTNVQQSDKKKQQQAPDAFAGKTAGGQYNTVGAHEGVGVFAAPIPILPEDRYFILEADVMGPEKSTALFYPQVLIRGFKQYDPTRDEGTFSWFQTPHVGGPAFSEQFGSAQRRARAGDYLMVFRHAMVCRNSAATIWEHYRMALELPQEDRFRPQVLLLKAYAMWPLGEYRFDNVVLRQTTEREFEAVRAQGHSIEGFMETK